jgi:hypothetical protein
MAFGLSWGNTTLSVYFILYVLISVSQGLYLVKYLYMQNKPISVMIVLVLLILVFIFFGKRWFQYGQLKGTTGWTAANANAIAKTNSQSGSTASSSSDTSTPASLMGISPPSDCPVVETPTKPTVWPPIVNHCPDFMILNTSGACVDTNKLYGTTQIGQTIIQPYKGNTNVCSQVTQASKSQYLRWEGVVQAEGACNPANIGKPPATQV